MVSVVFGSTFGFLVRLLVGSFDHPSFVSFVRWLVPLLVSSFLEWLIRSLLGSWELLKRG